MSSTITTIEANDLSVRSFRLGYRFGEEAATSRLMPRLEHVEHLADHWYFVANNPTAAAEERRKFLTWAEGLTIRDEAARQRAAWDAEEQAAFERARMMIATGHTDIAIAVELGLLLPVVANIRAGVL